MRDPIRPSTVPAALGAFVALLGVLTLVGWELSLGAIVAPYPAVPMKPNTAVAFTLLGVGLVAVSRGAGRMGRLALVLAAVAGSLALLTVLQDVTHLDFRMDNFLVRTSPLLSRKPESRPYVGRDGFVLRPSSLVSLGTLRARGRALALVLDGLRDSRRLRRPRLFRRLRLRRRGASDARLRQRDRAPNVHRIARPLRRPSRGAHGRSSGGVLRSVRRGRRARAILGRLIGEDVRLHLTLAPDTPCVRADRGQVEQALMNLAVNARDAMPSGGTLTFATAAVTIDKAEAALRPGLKAGKYARLTVSDTGSGMTPEVLARLFEPFFTTKERGKGTGLGLATTYGIVKQSEGHISVESEPGRGSTFEILLPAVDAAPDEAEPPAAAPRPGGETILLVEDEPSVRRLTRMALESRGYNVLDAASGEAALELSREHGGPVDLLLTDVVMPGMNGRVLAARLVALRPGTRVLYMSGYTDDAIAGHGVLDPGTEFLQKPFTPADVARKVRAVLDRP